MIDRVRQFGHLRRPFGYIDSKLQYKLSMNSLQ